MVIQLLEEGGDLIAQVPQLGQQQQQNSMSLLPIASSCRAAAELFGAPVLLQEGAGSKSKHIRSRRQHSSSNNSNTQTVCAALFVAASARCRPRSRSSSNSTRPGALRFAPALTQGKLRRRRRGSGSGSDDDCGSSWDDEAWQRLWSGDYNGSGGGNGSNGWGGGWGSGGRDPFHRALFEWLWVWQLVCVASMLQSWYFMLFPQQAMAELDATPDAAELVRARVVLAY